MAIKDYIKNLLGFRTRRKIVAFAVDDYGNVRLHSKKARDQLFEKNSRNENIFDQYDALETYDDIYNLIEVLHRFRDKNGSPACFSLYSVSCNLDFQQIIDNHYEQIFTETLEQTYDRLNETKTLSLIKEGIKMGSLCPEFHGREHFSFPILEQLIREKNEDLIYSIKHYSLAGIMRSNGKMLPYTIAFYDPTGQYGQRHREIISDGIKIFSKVYGIAPRGCMPPAATIHKALIPHMLQEGLKFIETYRVKKNKQSVFPYEFYYTGKKITPDAVYMVRNVVFEPLSDRSIDFVELAFQQIKTAFQLGKPAIISSHRVNFCGRIDEANRTFSLQELSRLLTKITKEWSDLEFMSTRDLAKYIIENQH